MNFYVFQILYIQDRKEHRRFLCYSVSSSVWQNLEPGQMTLTWHYVTATFQGWRFCHTDHRNIKLSDLPDRRQKNQLYVYFNHESPARFGRPGLKALKNFFNLSMTYRVSSDISYGYGEFVRVVQHPQFGPDLNKIINNFGAGNTQLAVKEKGNSGNESLVAQFVSHCSTNSRREKVISSLAKLINIHIYGRCGPLKCKKNLQDSSCYDVLNKTYKFYLSFENSLCKVRISR